ncbi:hypothetical protein A6A04_12120 [Paramagnetospirillum marisnigri]|uniref:Uncharacterized protein n=1 Tax=Paramagnetospirillum marisnigri TaxID=1285242 RepID=A0A178MWD0_9PROT|nr:tetratricopeptide repeat protein [Paramagnetospirillum marisnigri]OAN54664.1 hypothetical protein A6A04_12120 [Paramagnetospirillum marisnigri]
MNLDMKEQAESIGELIGQGMRCHAEGDIAEAERLYRVVLDQDPENVDGLHLLGLVAHATGHLDEAARLIGLAVERKPDQAVFLSNLGNVFLSMSQPAKAEAVLRRALTIAPDHAAGHNNLGLAMSAQGRFSEAAQCYRKALSLDRTLGDSFANLCTVLTNQGLMGEAEEAARGGVDVDPGNPDAVARLSQVVLKRGRAEEALALAKAALERSPSSSTLLTACGLARLELGQPIRALDYFERAERGEPKLVETQGYRKEAEARKPSDAVLLEQLLTAVRRGDVEMFIDVEAFRMPHSPLKVEFYANWALLMNVTIWGVSFWLLPQLWALGVGLGSAALYYLFGRKIVGNKMRAHIQDRLGADTSLWLKAWNMGGVSLRDNATGQIVSSPDGRWRLMVEDIAPTQQSPNP